MTGTSIFRTRSIALLLWCCAFTQLLSQNEILGVPEILNFSKSSYNAGTQNWCLLEDESGILLVGNNKGVLEFDGSNWRLFTLPNRTIARSLAVGIDKRIYVGGQDELGYLDRDDNGQISYYSLVEKIPPEDRSFEDVWKIFPQEERIFFGARRAFLIYEGQDVTVVHPEGRFENFFSVGDQIFAQDTEHGLMHWRGDGFVALPNGRLFSTSRIAGILPFGEQFLLVSDFNGLFLLNADGLTPWETPSSEFLRTHQAYCATMLSNGHYAVGTAQNGLIIIDQQGRPQLHLNKSSGLQNNTVLSILLDRQQNFWLGLDNGIDYVKISTPFSLIQSESGIDGTGYTSILFNDRLYAGTNQGLFYLDWPAGKNELKTSFAKLRGLSGQIWSLQELEGQLIANTHEGAYLIENENVRPISDIPGSWKFVPLSHHPGYALQGTYTGLYVYRQGASGNWSFSHSLPGFEESARIMEEDADGFIWVSHAYKGLYKIRLSEDLSSCSVQFYDSGDGLPTNINITAVKIQGEVVFSTSSGVYRYERDSDRFVAYENFNELLGGRPGLQRILEDDDGRIWYSYDDRFGYLDIRQPGFLRDIQVDRLDFNHLQEELVDGFEHINSIDDRHLIIGTEKGFTNYRPAEGRNRHLSFGVLIRRVQILSPQDSTVFGEGIAGKSDLPTPMELGPESNSLRFYFSSPFFEHIGQIEYRFRLDGYQDEWSDWSPRNEKDFTNLSYGDYHFEVEARNAYGQQSPGTSFSFTILPPWYAGPVAKVVYIALAAGLLFILFYNNTRRLARTKASLERQQAETLAKKEAIFQEEREKTEAEIIRLRNENLQADVKHKTAQLASATMHLVQKSEMMLKLKNELDRLLQSELSSDDRRKVQKLIHTIETDIRLDDDWGQFESYFDQVHENFLQNLRKAYPELTPKDQKLCAYLRMNLSTKEIAPLMNISVRGVEISRYRLRKKLELTTDTNLTDFIMRF